MEKVAEQKLVIGGKDVSEWDTGWTRVLGGFVTPHRKLRQKVGLFRGRLNHETVVIGMGSQSQNGGLEARLSDFRRAGDHNRSHYAGLMIRKHLLELELEVLEVGSNYTASLLVLPLRRAMLKLHDPVWNRFRGLVH